MPEHVLAEMDTGSVVNSASMYQQWEHLRKTANRASLARAGTRANDRDAVAALGIDGRKKFLDDRIGAINRTGTTFFS